MWTKLGGGDNIVDWSATAQLGSHVSPLTSNRTNNSEAAWQPVPTNPILPEAPYAVLLPGGALVLGALVIGLRRRRAVTTRR